MFICYKKYYYSFCVCYNHSTIFQMLFYNSSEYITKNFKLYYMLA